MIPNGTTVILTYTQNIKYIYLSTYIRLMELASALAQAFAALPAPGVRAFPVPISDYW